MRNQDSALAGAGIVQRLQPLGPTRTGLPVGLAPCGRVATLAGPVPAAELKPGDLVLTRDSGYRAVLWAGQAGRAVPGVRLDAAGPLLSCGQMVARPGDADPDEVLVPAGALDGGSACPAPLDPVLILFDRHEVILAGGLWIESHGPAQITDTMDPRRAEAVQAAVAPFWRDHRPSRPLVPMPARARDAGPVPGAA